MNNLFGAICQISPDGDRLFEIKQTNDGLHIVIQDKEDDAKPELGVVVEDIRGVKEYLRFLGPYVKRIVMDCRPFDSCDGLFAYCFELEYLEFTSKWTPTPGMSANYFIAGCSNLKEIVCRGWDLRYRPDKQYLFKCNAEPMVTACINGEWVTDSWDAIMMRLPIEDSEVADSLMMSLMRSGRFSIEGSEAEKAIQKLVKEKEQAKEE